MDKTRIITKLKRTGVSISRRMLDEIGALPQHRGVCNHLKKLFHVYAFQILLTEQGKFLNNGQSTIISKHTHINSTPINAYILCIFAEAQKVHSNHFAKGTGLSEDF